MPVTRRDVDHIAALAHLRLAPEEAGRMKDELNAILRHVDALAEADEESAPVHRVGPDAAPSREPGAIPSDSLHHSPREFAPDWREGLFVVPRLPALGSDPDVAKGS